MNVNKGIYIELKEGRILVQSEEVTNIMTVHGIIKLNGNSKRVLVMAEGQFVKCISIDGDAQVFPKYNSRIIYRLEPCSFVELNNRGTDSEPAIISSTKVNALLTNFEIK